MGTSKTMVEKSTNQNLYLSKKIVKSVKKELIFLRSYANIYLFNV